MIRAQPQKLGAARPQTPRQGAALDHVVARDFAPHQPGFAGSQKDQRDSLPAFLKSGEAGADARRVS